MDYYQGIVAEYLDADRSVFLNTECFIQLQPGLKPPKNTTWYCDILAINLREKTVYLCEISYSKGLSALIERLRAWDHNWQQVCDALRRDCSIPVEWPLIPWIFIPEDRWPTLDKKLKVDRMPLPLVTYLEKIVPWTYSSDSRIETIINQNAQPGIGGNSDALRA
jgi:hypothetical protein